MAACAPRRAPEALADVAIVAALDAAYLRLGLDPCASLEERAMVWLQAKKAGQAEGLAHKEEQALRQLLSQVKMAKLDGGEVFEHMALSPSQQIEVMTVWRTNISTWQQRPLEQQRSPAMQLWGKAAKNAFCCRRPRDAWKGRSLHWLEEMKRCVAFAAEHIEGLWRGDAISHHPLFEIVLSAPQTLAPVLAAALPSATEVSIARSAALWNAYERAIVCVLRSRHSAACEAIAPRIFYQDWGLDGLRRERLRLASHTVRHAIPAGDMILKAWLEAPPSTLKKLLGHHSGLCALKACLSTDTTAEYLPMLLRRQQELATRLQRLAQNDLTLQTLLCPASGRKLGRRVAQMMSSVLSTDPSPQKGIDVLLRDVPRGTPWLVERMLEGHAEGHVEELPEKESAPPQKACVLDAAGRECPGGLSAEDSHIAPEAGSTEQEKRHGELGDVKAQFLKTADSQAHPKARRAEPEKRCKQRDDASICGTDDTRPVSGTPQSELSTPQGSDKMGATAVGAVSFSAKTLELVHLMPTQQQPEATVLAHVPVYTVLPSVCAQPGYWLAAVPAAGGSTFPQQVYWAWWAPCANGAVFSGGSMDTAAC